jgi:aryl-alcohol dehydrogenase-like predicted oxidoreductase
MKRRSVLAALAATCSGVLPFGRQPHGGEPARLTKPIPATQEPLPVIGMGTWITFNVGDDSQALDVRAEILRAFFAAGGGMIDSSPMYGSSETVVGKALTRLGRPAGLFAATKVWTASGDDGPREIAESQRLWRV